ncbi:MAG: ElyC/SanA/YdcF family protein [Pyrinomonadaceae bacterium]|nr:ElyC/SanA/YdcF family protein [Pyrinomonadaceae bacterium]
MIHLRRLLFVLLAPAVLVLLAIISINRQVGSYSAERVYDDVQSLPADHRVAIVLGARVRNGEPSDMLYDRVLTGADLYKAGKTRKLLMSGGDDEPEVMKRLAVEFGVPESDVILDDLGTRTYESCIRAKQVFGLTSVTIVTQDFHLPRSIYLCQNLGVDSIGVNAKRRDYQAEGFGRNREYLSRVRAWYDVNF